MFWFRLSVFVLLGNPLSMFVFNLLFPRYAAKFARNDTIFGAQIRAFYEYCALKWPFYWACWWMRLENLADYSVDRQISYFFKVSFNQKTETETLKAMQKYTSWPDVYEKLFFEFGDKKLPREEVYSYGHYDNKVCCYIAKVTVAEFMMQRVRLNFYALQEVIKQAKYDDRMKDNLKKYLASGKLNDEQFKILLEAVTTSPHSGDLQILGVLVDYVKRYGINKNHMEYVQKHYPQAFTELIEETAKEHAQKRKG